MKIVCFCHNSVQCILIFSFLYSFISLFASSFRSFINNNKVERILEDNTEFKKKLEKKFVPEKEYLKVPIGDGYGM